MVGMILLVREERGWDDTTTHVEKRDWDEGKEWTRSVNSVRGFSNVSRAGFINGFLARKTLPSEAKDRVFIGSGRHG